MPARIEHDSLGEVAVPEDSLWGAQTERCRQNFPVGAGRYQWGRPVIRAFGIVKKCAARVNGELETLPAAKASALEKAAQEVIEGKWDSQFPLVIFQTGSGTQSNMNANEVIARRAGQLLPGSGIHPNDDANRSQSSNDVFPTVMHVATVEQWQSVLRPALTQLSETLTAKAEASADIPLVGRTHLQDAAPILLGQVISGWVAQLKSAESGIIATLPGLSELAIGGTAVGTGLNAPPQFAARMAAEISLHTGHAFISAPNKFAALSAHDAISTLSGALRTLAGALFKVANDLRWYASGPRTGIGELSLPENEPGSSIMPGKINPTQCESLMQVAVQVYGNDQAVAFACSQGNFQLNTFKPVILYNVLESITLLAQACHAFDEHCIRGLEPNVDRMREHLEVSLIGATALNPHIGYEKAAQISLAAQRGGLTLREAALQSGHVTPAQFDQWVRPLEMARPNE